MRIRVEPWTRCSTGVGFAMKQKAVTGGKAPTVERRSGKDRRQRDQPPPRGIDRRREMEPRKPEIVELDMSNSEWARLSDDPLQRAKGPPT